MRRICSGTADMKSDLQTLSLSPRPSEVHKLKLHMEAALPLQEINDGVRPRHVGTRS